MAEAEIAPHLGAAKVEVAILEAEVFVGDAAFEGEREDVGFVENGDGGGDDLDLAGGKPGVLRAEEARGDGAGDGDHVFATEAVRLLGDLRVLVGTKDDLRNAFAVAEIDKNDAAVVTARVDPAGKGDGGVGVDGAEGGAVVGAIHG